MMKKTVFVAVALMASILCSFADEQKKIVLNNGDHPQEVVELPYCNITATLKEEDDLINISIEMENIQESKVIILFDRAYGEKELKKQHPSIRYHKIFPGSKGRRIIDYCRQIDNSAYLKPYQKISLNSLNVAEDSEVVCRLPIYIAELSDKDLFKLQLSKKLQLQELQVIELQIQVKLKPDEEYVNFEKAYLQLLDDISKETFCKNKNHRGTSFIRLVDDYSKKIDGLKRDIENLARERNYLSASRKYKMYEGLLTKLNEIDFESMAVESCDNDRASHSCRYCSWSYDKIYKRLENIYIDLHNGKMKKQEVTAEVEALYRCSARNSKRARNDSYKSRIKTYYDKIKSL